MKGYVAPENNCSHTGVADPNCPEVLDFLRIKTSPAVGILSGKTRLQDFTVSNLCPKTDLFRKYGLIALFVVLACKVIGVAMRGPSPLVLDAKMYWELGGMVAEGDWLMMGKRIAYRTPVYPWLIGALRSLSSHPLMALVALQSVLWLATIGLAAGLAMHFKSDRRVGMLVIGGAIAMFSSAVYVSTALTETLFVFSLMLHLWAVAKFTRFPTVGGGVFVGLTLAFAILTRPVAMLLWIADLIFVVFSWYGGSLSCETIQTEASICRRRGWICIGLAGIVTLLGVSPWLARNHAMFGKAMLTEFVGRNIWIVTFQDGSGAGLDFPDSPSAITMQKELGTPRWQALSESDDWRDTWKVCKALTATGMEDPAADRLMKQVALDAISRSPTPFAKKTLRRWINFWRTRATELPAQTIDLPPNANHQDLYLGESPWGVTVAPVDTALRYRWSNWLAGNTFLMVLTAVSTMLLLWRRETRSAGFWFAAILGYFTTITAVLEIPAYRYRLIVEPLVLLVIVLAFSEIVLPKPNRVSEPTTTPAT